MSTRAKPTAAPPSSPPSPSLLRADRNSHNHRSARKPPLFSDHVPIGQTPSSTSIQPQPPPPPPAPPLPGGTVRSTLLQPRVAVALGVSKKWYPALFLCRLASIAPGVLFGLPSALRLLATLHLMYLDRVLGDGGGLLYRRLVAGVRTGAAAAGVAAGGVGEDGNVGVGGGSGILGSGGLGSSGYDAAFEARLRLTEALLATIWCCASGYLSFFFTDCLMSRWLLHYTPQATIVRLLTVDAMNAYLTSWVLHLMGGFEDPRLVLPAWILISTTLTVLYHITQRKINIRKETSMSISVFSIASFVSMVALLAQLNSNRSDYPDIPLVNLARKASQMAGRLALRLMDGLRNDMQTDGPILSTTSRRNDVQQLAPMQPNFALDLLSVDRRVLRPPAIAYLCRSILVEDPLNAQ
ncbi:hypothetical protein VTJ49DRAFT_2107 [Mycothermus thermophilus]|uniref:N-glycosylation protein EOS1 n=1 Tax=Humicola insolens TaxID=85995 RepID=A0ABR3VAM7_HUMIN